tara:strand:+ start:1830 stop:2744 length:915 start_codon:yes stop_codon:yes gene_type:complete
MLDPFDDLPSWSTRFNFTAHSPSGSIRPNCKEFFEKAVARPAKLFSPAGCRMTAGKIAEKYAKDIVIEGEDPSTAFRDAMSDFDAHAIVEHDPADADRHSVIRDGIYQIPKTDPKIEGTVLELTCQHTAAGLQEATQGANEVTDGRWVSVKLEDVELDFIGEIDVEDRGVVEIKTKWPTLTERVKRGWQINSLPARPDPNHVGQVALYWKWLRQQSENVPVKIVYANCKGYRLFSSTDCEELSEDRLSEALDRMRIVARTREQLMKNADTLEDLFSMIAPDFSHFMWKDVPPAYRSAAEKTWGV